MKNAIFAVVLVASIANVWAVELVCEGRQQRDASQRAVSVDCTKRKEVIDMLGAAWQTLRNESIGGSTEDMCWSPYKQAKEMHPSISPINYAPTFFIQCNMALKYVK